MGLSTAVALARRLDAYEDQVLADVRTALDAHLASWTRLGVKLPEPEELAQALTAGLPDAPPSANSYASLIGPFYSSAGVRRVLNIPSKQALDDRRQRETILAARTEDDVWVYPAFQFDVRNRCVYARLAPVIAALKGAPRWGSALWLTTAHSELGGVTPIDASKKRAQLQLVITLAEQYATAARSE